MKMIIFFMLLNSFSFGRDDAFVQDASSLSKKLKEGLVKAVTEKIQTDGVEKAVEYCHLNVKAIAKSTAKNEVNKFEFGRTAFKLRNKSHRPESWMVQYLEKFKSSRPGQIPPEVHVLSNGKRFYLDPIYMQPVCLNCHGENIKSEVLKKISELYPEDQAVGLKVGEFRGFIWITPK
jgi:hypothetical protein